jgi:hypothetical protein
LDRSRKTCAFPQREVDLADHRVHLGKRFPGRLAGFKRDRKRNGFAVDSQAFLIALKNRTALGVCRPTPRWERASRSVHSSVDVRERKRVDGHAISDVRRAVDQQVTVGRARRDEFASDVVAGTIEDGQGECHVAMVAPCASSARAASQEAESIAISSGASCSTRLAAVTSQRRTDA